MNETTNLSLSLSKISKLTEKDVAQLHLLSIDFFAAAFAGYRQNKDFNNSVEKVIFSQGGEKESTVLFNSRKAPSRIAAFINAIYGHGAELDDGNKKAAGHVGVHVFPAVFALSEKLRSTNNDVLIALATGYEAYIRISSAAMPGMVKRGFHSTGVTGTLACAAACARLYGLDAQRIEDAIALATTMTGGLLSYGDSRPAIKPLNPAKAAENGVFAAMLANEGVHGPTESLEGINGWFHAVTDEVHKEYLEGSDHLLLHDCYFKLYPSCRHTHCGIDAATVLHQKINPQDIAAVRVYIYPNAIKLAGIKFPKNQDETKFSIQYTLACALVNGSYGISDMDVSNISPDVINLINKISLIPDGAMENREKGIRGTRVEVITLNGEHIEETILVPRGDPENPLTREDIIEKLHICAKTLATDNDLDLLVKSIDGIKGNDMFINPMTVLGGVL